MRSTLVRATSVALAALFSLSAATCLTAQTRLEMGKMWTFENPPLAYLEEEYGFKPTTEWMEALRLASLRLADKCSASFVSPKGLIMTNNHCVRDDVAKVSSADHDYVENGFYASSQEEELQLPGLTVQQLVSMRDVTTEMLAGIGAGDDDTAAEKKREANEKAILAKARQADRRLEPEIVTLHNGAVFQLYSYKVWDDVRLVCTPHLQSAHFGGDPDNFTYPRYCMDFAFCRAYEDGVPADTAKHYFRWSKTGAVENDLVFVTGNPGSTGRLLTLAQMEYLRDAEYPLVLGMLEQRLAILRVIADTEPELERRLRTIILGDENSVKALTGYLGGLLDEELMAQKAELEVEFRAKVEADPELNEKYGEVWDRLADICEARAELEPKRFFHEPSYSTQLARALAIVTAVDPDAPSEERDAARRMALGIEMRNDQLFQVLFINHLLRAKQWLGEDDPYVKVVLGGDDPITAAQRMIESKVSSREYAAELLRGGAEAVAESIDPAIAAARILAPLTRAHAEENERLMAQEATQSRLVGLALFACYGDKISPDATMTLRFSDGRVEGYTFNGTIAPYRTTFYGLYGRNVEFGNEVPFDLPPLWLQKRETIDLAKAVNFVSTNDIIGGNSGSPVVDVNLHVVGLIFDGNIEQLPNRFLFRDSVERSVSVHVEGMLEAMSAVYGADRVVKELTEGM